MRIWRAIPLLALALAIGCARTHSYQVPARHIQPPMIPDPFDAEMGRAAGEFFLGCASITGEFLSAMSGSSDNGAAAVFALTIGAAPIAVGTLPVIGWLGYSTVGAGSMAVSHTVRTVAVDIPKAVVHRMRTRKSQIQRDIRRLVKYWNGPPLRPNRWLAVRGSADAIRAHAGRLERTTGRRLGVHPARWIEYYEKKYGPWKWERP